MEGRRGREKKGEGKLTLPKGFAKFTAWVILAGVVSTIIFILVFNSLGRAVDYPAVISNLVYSIFNVLIGVVVVLSGIDKKSTVFFSRLLGSLFVRILIMSGYVVLGLAVFKFEEVNFVLSLFIYYFLFLLLEMMYIFPKKDEQNPPQVNDSTRGEEEDLPGDKNNKETTI